MIITAQDLVTIGACVEGRRWFQEEFHDKAQAWQIVVALAKMGKWDWIDFFAGKIPPVNSEKIAAKTKKHLQALAKKQPKGLQPLAAVCVDLVYTNPDDLDHIRTFDLFSNDFAEALSDATDVENSAAQEMLNELQNAATDGQYHVIAKRYYPQNNSRPK